MICKVIIMLIAVIVDKRLIVTPVLEKRDTCSALLRYFINQNTYCLISLRTQVIH